MSQELLVARDGAITTITLNRPEKYNAITFSMYRSIAEACEEAGKDGVTRAIIITGAGGKAFAAGTDIAQFRSFATPEDGIRYEASIDNLLSAIEACPVPTIAALAGACTGGGAAIASCCDMRIATRSLKYGYPIARTLGNCLSAASLQRLSSLLGPQRVIELIYTARLIEADEALRIGLVSELVEDHAAVMARARQLASQIAGHAPMTLAVTKELMRRNRQASGSKVDDHDLVGQVYTSADFREGLDSFLAKRPPQWTGR